MEEKHHKVNDTIRMALATYQKNAKAGNDQRVTNSSWSEIEGKTRRFVKTQKIIKSLLDCLLQKLCR